MLHNTNKEGIANPSSSLPLQRNATRRMNPSSSPPLDKMYHNEGSAAHPTCQRGYSLVVISRPFSHRRGGGSTLLVIPGDVRRRYGSLYLDIYVNNILF